MKIIAVTLFILGLTIHQGTYAENSDVTIVIDGKVYTTKDSLPSGSSDGSGGFVKSDNYENNESEMIVAMTLEERLGLVNASSFDKADMVNGIRVESNGRNFGQFDVNSKDTLLSLTSFLDENKLLLGNSRGYEFIIHGIETADPKFTNELGYTRSKIRFSQVVQGLHLPTSTLTVVDGSVVYLEVNLANPHDVANLIANSLPLRDLLTLAKDAAQSHFGSFDNIEIDSPVYRIMESKDGSRYTVIFEVQFGAHVIRIDATNGMVAEEYSTMDFQDECEWIDDSALTNHLSCASTTVMETFRINNQCVGSHPNCENEKYQQSINSVLTMSAWASIFGAPGPSASNFDIMYEARNPTNIADRSAWHTGYTNGTSTVGTGTGYLGGSSEERDDTIKHEWNHAWHYSRTHPATLPSGNFFAVAMGESIADTFRAFSENDWVQNLTSGGSRNLNNGTTWSNWNSGVNFNTSHKSSVILSDLFYEIQFEIGLLKGMELFIDMADQAKGSSYTTISEFREDLRNYIYNPIFLQPSQRAAICQIWQQKGMPGTLCSVPDKPSWISVINTGQCGYFPVPGGYAYGSKFTVSWANVTREDSFQLQHSQNPFVGYTTLLTTARDVTTALPYYYYTNDLFYVAVRACNESGCGELTGAPAQNTCSLN